MTMQPITSRYFNQIVLPFNYDAGAQCPNFLAFLDEVLPHQSEGDRRQELVQEFMGYSVTQDCRHEKMLILTGEGRNGKSTLLNVWEAMLGRENVRHMPYAQLGQEFRLGELEGALANFASDLPHLGKTDEGLLKQLISGEPVNVNRKHKSPIEITPFAKLVVACNTLPSFVDPTMGIWRRLIVIPFEVVIAEDQVNPVLAAQLKQELPGIFNWAIRGLRRLRQQGGFSQCEVCEEVLGSHRQQSDSVIDFMLECCCPAETDRCALIAQRLYEVYAHYCKTTGRKSVARNEFGRRLKSMGRVAARVSIHAHCDRLRGYHGLQLTAEGVSWVGQYVRSQSKPAWNSILVWEPDPDVAAAAPDSTGPGD